MALVKCKECGHEISKKAEICPNCGAKRKKGTSLATWFVLILIILFFIAFQQQSDYSSAMDSALKVESLEEEKRRPSTDWTFHQFEDEMTGAIVANATSNKTYPSRRMSFPYSDVNAWIGFGCNNKQQWAFIGFNASPNLSDDKTKDGYNLIQTRIKWNENIESATLTQEWGAKFLHFQDIEQTIANIKSASKALLELQWHGEEAVYFEFSLKGSSNAIAQARKICTS